MVVSVGSVGLVGAVVVVVVLFEPVVVVVACDAVPLAVPQAPNIKPAVAAASTKVPTLRRSPVRS
jgi:hypothetical protein